MAALAQIFVIIACLCLADCRLRSGFYKHVPVKNQRITENTGPDKNVSADQVHQTIGNMNSEGNHLLNKDKAVKDADAIVFPSDVDRKIYPDVNKMVNEDHDAMDFDKHKNVAVSTPNVNNEVVAVPLISKVVPAIEAKEVFTNPIALEGTEDVTSKVFDYKETANLKPIGEAKVPVVNNKNVTLDTLNIAVDDNKEIQNLSNDTNANETVPDFSNRFGVTGNYVLVPVNNVQTYQPLQTINNVPVSNVQGAPLTYVANNDQASAINPLVGVNSQYTPNVASNIGTNPQYVANGNDSPNAGLNLYAAPANPQPTVNYNGNIAQGNYIRINVPNTYMINGQLYAAVTVPNNVNVPNSLYFVNPQQVSGYQVANNLPLYKLVSVGSQVDGQVGSQVGQGNNLKNAQYVLK